MPIISKVGRKSFRMRLLIGFVYGVLIIFSVTMIYPFLLMLSTSISSGVDYYDFKVVPRYFFDKEVLFAKYIETRYDRYAKSAGWVQELNRRYKTSFFKIQDVGVIKTKIIDDNGKEILTGVDANNEKIRTRAADWTEFKKTLPDKYHVRSFDIEITEKYRYYLRKRFNGDINKLKALYKEDVSDFFFIGLPSESPLIKIWEPEDSIKYKEWKEFLQSLPWKYRMVVSGDKFYIEWLQRRFANIQMLNATYEASYESFDDIFFPLRQPTNNENETKDWTTFVKRKWSLRYITLSGGENEYHEYLQTVYDSIDKLNQAYHSNYASFDEVPLTSTPSENSTQKGDWSIFFKNHLPAKYIEIDSAEARYYKFLQQKYHNDLEELNVAHGTNYRSFETAILPYRESDRVEFEKHYWKIYFGFIFGNYMRVFNFILLHGPALFNTLVLVTISVASALTVNPLCAYGLSRFRLPCTHKILLFLLATMAFPAEVSMIPSFLLMKQLGLLNTYGALVLPGLANGFAIFLLKGFFDSLPEELYEAARIDGANEIQMFYMITIPLCKPIFALMALGAFVSAYGGFMWAFIICQNPKMWTIMVYLYQFQQDSPPYLVMAALTVASIPPLLVFIFCQRIILRGIILPVMR